MLAVVIRGRRSSSLVFSTSVAVTALESAPFR